MRNLKVQYQYNKHNKKFHFHHILFAINHEKFGNPIRNEDNHTEIKFREVCYLFGLLKSCKVKTLNQKVAVANDFFGGCCHLKSTKDDKTQN